MATNSPDASVVKSAPSVSGLVQYLKDVREELKKAHWPTRTELIQMTQVVLVLIALVALYCGGLDAILSMVTSKMFSR